MQEKIMLPLILNTEDWLMKQIYSHLNENGKCVFSMSHPISTAYDGTFDRYTRTETGERLYANLRNYGIEGKRVIHWVVDEYELYHRTISTLINDINIKLIQAL